MSKVAIVHLDSTQGHQLIYAQCFVEAARQVYARVTVLVPEAVRATAAMHLVQSGVEVTGYRSAGSIRIGKRQLPPYLKQFLHWIAVRRYCAASGRSDLIIPYFESLASGMSLLRPPPQVDRIIALTMRADLGQHDTPQGVRLWFKRRQWRRAFRHSSSPLSAVNLWASNDPCLYQYLQVRAYDQSSKVRLLEDFTDCFGLPALTVTSSRLRCVLLGHLDARKNLSVALQGALFCGLNLGLRVEVALVGRFFPEELNLAGHAALSALASSGAVTIQTEFVDTERYRDALSNADVVWVAYRDHPFSSGVALDAIASGRGLLAQSTGVIAHLAAQYPLSQTIPDDASPAVVAEAMKELHTTLLARRGEHDGMSRPLEPRPEYKPNNRTAYVAQIASLLIELSGRPA